MPRTQQALLGEIYIRLHLCASMRAMCRYFVGIQLVAIQVVAIQVVGIQVVEQGMPFGFQRVLPMTDIRHWQIVVECQLSAVSVNFFAFVLPAQLNDQLCLLNTAC